MKTNYQLLMENELQALAQAGKTPRLLLHVCCAPCSSACLDTLCSAFFVTCYYDNPNISPREEFERRAAELTRLTEEMPLTRKPAVEIGAYEPERFEAIAEGIHDAPEGGERCLKCYRLRLQDTAQKAALEGYDYFATTLTLSPLKNAEKLNQIGAELSALYGVRYLYSDFKKKDGYLRSIRLSEEYGLYRQDFCGCEYSKRQREGRKAHE